MHGTRATTIDSKPGKGSWSEIFRDGRGLYSALVIGGIAMNATQMLVIAIIMPTIVRDIGGASFYTWAAMLYTIRLDRWGRLDRHRLGSARATAQLYSRRVGFCVGHPVMRAGA